MNDNWFTDAAKQASGTQEAERIREIIESREKFVQRTIREERMKRARATIDVTAAQREFGAAPLPPRAARIKPDDAVTALMKHVKESDDPLSAAGEWISKVTNELSAVARDYLDENPDRG